MHSMKGCLIIDWLHSAPKSSYSRRDMAIKRVKSLFYWKGLTKEVREFVRKCQVCQASRYDTTAQPRGLISQWTSLLDFQGLARM